jgi:hypothetical protein
VQNTRPDFFAPASAACTPSRRHRVAERGSKKLILDAMVERGLAKETVDTGKVARAAGLKPE